MSGSAIRSVNASSGADFPQPSPGGDGAIVDLAEVRRRRDAEAGGQATPRIRVRIYCLGHCPKQHGMAPRPWALEFEPTTPTRTDPLMGWIGWSDPRQQVRVLFSTKARAIAFAERQGWAYDLSEPPTKPAGLVDEIRHHAARPVSIAGLGEWHAVM